MTHDYSFLLVLIAPLVLGSKWILNKAIKAIKKNERKRIANLSNQRFVYDVATNHLPHIQDSLALIAKSVGVNLPDPPPIRFMEPVDIEKDKEDS